MYFNMRLIKYIHFHLYCTQTNETNNPLTICCFSRKGLSDRQSCPDIKGNVQRGEEAVSLVDPPEPCHIHVYVTKYRSDVRHRAIGEQICTDRVWL